MCSPLCCLHTAIHISSLCGFWHCHPYIPIHFWKMFFKLVCVPLCCTTLPYRRLSLSTFSTNTFSMHVSMFVEKGLSCPSNLDVSNSKLEASISRYILSMVSVASKYNSADYRTVHHCDSLLRFRFLLGSETQ